ncbi:MAG TPA: hypothetical protein VJQ60_11900 [Arthrobacter sp.]|nr:hypothetical protein [Arthrobacter sp.]
MDGIQQAGPPRFLFLVGGPGAGKSHATATVVEGLTAVAVPDDGLAHRMYEFQGPYRHLSVLNDATIGLSSGDDTTLATDISRAAHDGSDFMGCVNRGILVEEAGHVRNRPEEERGAGDVVSLWLHGVSKAGHSGSGWKMATESSGDFLQSGTLSHDGNIMARVVAVFVDVCSLFEKRPSLIPQAGSGIGSLAFTPYAIEYFGLRHAMDEASIPAADLLNTVLRTLGRPEAGSGQLDADPIAANVRALAAPRVRAGLLTIARASEIATASRMTYRETWGLLTRAVVGNAPAETKRDGLRQFLLDNQPEGTTEQERFQKVKRLANLRFSQALFGAGEIPASSVGVTRNPVLKFTTLVDPVRDAIPGHEDGNMRQGWATPISEAFAGHVHSASPLEALVEASGDGPFRDAVDAFDVRVDDAYKDLMGLRGIKDKDRFEATFWYGTYLTRLYAVANGIPAFRSQLAVWVEAWRHQPHLPDEIDKPLKTLLRPKRNPDSDSTSLIPVFDSRTEAITGRVNSPKIALRFGDIELKSSRNAEELFLDLSEDGKPLGRIALDFPLVREALACNEAHAGVTDLIDVTAPRLERFRASRLVAEHLRQAQFSILSGDEDIQLTLATGGY